MTTIKMISGLPQIKPFVRDDMTTEERAALVGSTIIRSKNDDTRMDDLAWWRGESTPLYFPCTFLMIQALGTQVFDRYGDDLLSCCKRGEEDIRRHGPRLESIHRRFEAVCSATMASGSRVRSQSQAKSTAADATKAYLGILSQLKELTDYYNSTLIEERQSGVKC